MDLAGLGGSRTGVRPADPKVSSPQSRSHHLSGLQVSLQAAPVESPDPGQCLGLLRLDSVESVRL